MKLESFYIHVTPEESAIVQELLFKCGYSWESPPAHITDKHLNYPYLKIESEEFIKVNDGSYFEDGVRTITLEELLNEIESKLEQIQKFW